MRASCESKTLASAYELSHLKQ